MGPIARERNPDLGLPVMGCELREATGRELIFRVLRPAH